MKHLKKFEDVNQYQREMTLMDDIMLRFVDSGLISSYEVDNNEYEISDNVITIKLHYQDDIKFNLNRQYEIKSEIQERLRKTFRTVGTIGDTPKFIHIILPTKD